MKLSWIEKERFYHEVAQYIRSGISLQEALQSMAETGDSGKARRMARRLLRDSQGAGSLYATFAHLDGVFTELELSLIEAAEQSGRLEQAFRYLAEYYHNLHEARSEVIRRSMYPAFILHFATFILPLPELITQKTTLADYLIKTLGTLSMLYAAAILLYLLASMLLQLGRSSGLVDGLIRLVPLLGRVQATAAFARFCMTLEMQLQAGISPLQALPVAGRASQSGLILRRARSAPRRIDAGQELADALGKPGPLPANILRALRLGQQAGSLDEELRRWGAFYQQQTLNRIRTISEWVPKILYLVIAAYVAYRIIGAAQGVSQQMMQQIEEL